MNGYRYNCVDKSILLPYFKNYYVAFYHRFIPQILTANFITLISTGFIVLLLWASVSAGSVNTPLFAFFIAFCLHAYLVGDHLDGMQAKKTGTSSALGEYLDHYLDVYNGAIVVYVLTLFFAPIPRPVFYSFLVLNAISFAIVMVEELERKELVFGYMGTLEGVAFLILFFLAWSIEPFRLFWLTELFGGFARYWVLILLFALGYLFTLVDGLWRIGYAPRQFIVFLIVNCLLAYSLFELGVGSLASWGLITLHSGEYISKVMESYLVGKQHQYPDHLFSLLTLIAALSSGSEILSPGIIKYLLGGMAIYLLIKVVILFIRVLYQLRENWLWLNPSN